MAMTLNDTAGKQKPAGAVEASFRTKQPQPNPQAASVQFVG
jgi:hypothetical protein